MPSDASGNAASTQPQHPRGPIQLSLRSIQQLFYSLDPSPFRDRDLDPEAARFIIEEAEERSRDEALSILLHIPAEEEAKASFVEGAIHNYFALCRVSEERRLRRTFREGRWALFVGLLAFVAIVAVAQLVAAQLRPDSLFQGIVQTLEIFAWVILWRPAELLLYDWWPIWRQIKLFRRLEVAKVECRNGV